MLGSMRTHSKGVMSTNDYLKASNLNGGYALGLTSVRDDLGIKITDDVYPALAAAKGIEDWPAAYRRMGLPQNDPDSVRKFMEAITRENKPIVMFVPKGLKSYKNKSWATKFELKWLMENPERMKNVHFVFGAYDTFPEVSLQPMLGLTATRKREILTEYLKFLSEK